MLLSLLKEYAMGELTLVPSQPGSEATTCGLSQIWPHLSTIGLSEAQKGARRSGIGGSDANIILSGNVERIHRLWSEKRVEMPEEDLSSVLPVMLGSWTEAFNRQWYERQTGFDVTDAGLFTICPRRPWRRATVDGLVMEKSSVWEAKHVNAFAKPDEVLAKYMPQLQHNMAVLGLENAVLSVIYGNHKWEVYEVASDWLYQDDLLVAETHFWESVKSGRAPVAAPSPPAPRPIAVREVCLEGRNAWAAAATDWLVNRNAAQLHTNAVKTLKELVEEDVTRAYGHGVEAKRSKAGAITIRELA